MSSAITNYKESETHMDNHYHDYLTDAYKFLNRIFFDGQLPETIITLSHHKGANGYFRTNAFGTGKHELALTPTGLHDGTYEALATLLHEMCHVWQQHFGKFSKNGYHNKQWATKMLEVGLTPVSIDQPGKMTGFKVTHAFTDKFLSVIIKFVKYQGHLVDESIKPTIKSVSKVKKVRPQVKCKCRKFSLPNIENVKIICELCGEEMVIQEAYSETVEIKIG